MIDPTLPAPDDSDPAHLRFAADIVQSWCASAVEMVSAVYLRRAADDYEAENLKSALPQEYELTRALNALLRELAGTLGSEGVARVVAAYWGDND